MSASFVRACGLAELAEGAARSVEIDGDPVAVVYTEGEVYAIRDMCSHAQVPLSLGEVSGHTIECWLHGSRFDLRTGRPVGRPATRAVPVYPVSIQGGDVYVAHHR
ncbi:MAG: non-heme iron oxygenase ferredoxin subunit [Mycobacteriales bacterium]